MAKAGSVLALLLTVARLGAAQQVSVDSAVVAALTPFTHDSVEHVACLYGTASPEHISLTSFELPPQRALGTHSAAADARLCSAAIAIFHNHPVPHDSLRASRSYLYFTLSDQYAFLGSTNAAIAAVGVPDAWCLWTRLQVQSARARNLTPLPAVWQQCFPVP